MDLNGVVTLKIIPTWFDKDNNGNVVKTNNEPRIWEW